MYEHDASSLLEKIIGTKTKLVGIMEHKDIEEQLSEYPENYNLLLSLQKAQNELEGIEWES